MTAPVSFAPALQRKLIDHIQLHHPHMDVRFEDDAFAMALVYIRDRRRPSSPWTFAGYADDMLRAVPA